MTVFGCKEAFEALGIKQVPLTNIPLQHNCTVCVAPLVLPLTSSPHSSTTSHLSAVRITACGHIIGEECLHAWVEVGNSCPTCRRLLFEEARNQPLTDGDIRYVFAMFAPTFGDAKVKRVIVRLLKKRQEEMIGMQKYYEQEVMRQKMNDEMGGNGDFLLGGEDFADSETDNDEDDEDEDENDGEYEDEDDGEYEEEDEEENEQDDRVVE